MKLLSGVALFVLAFSLNAQAPETPKAVAIKDEPHHHLVFENEHVRVFRVHVPARDATLLHQHDVPYLYVSLGPADVVNAVQGKPEARIVMADGQVGYSLGHFAHIARTDAGSTFDNVTIELLMPQGNPSNLCAEVIRGEPIAPCEKMFKRKGTGYLVEPQVETGEVRVDLITLGPEAEHIDGAAHKDSVLCVALFDSHVKFDIAGEPAKTINGGEVVWLGANSHVTMSNPGKRPSRLLFLDFYDDRAIHKD